MNKPERLAHYLLKSLRKANRSYELISDGDRVAIGISGGKDSQTLLQLLHQWQSYAPFHYDLVAIHISMRDVFDQAIHQETHLARLFESMDIEHDIRPIDLPKDEPLPLNCYRCSWNRRKTLFRAAKELNCNKVALAHHANDIAETTLLNLLYHGRFESMAPRKEMFGGEITLIRPLVLIEEKDIVYYAKSANLDIETSCCPNSKVTKRAEIKNLLKSIKDINPKAQINLFRAVERIGWEID
jgi:tRNA 2-thiocytidine biosynthesis protein TtcA